MSISISIPYWPRLAALSHQLQADDARGLALRATAWTIGSYAIGQVLRLASNLILTRLLFPEAFGLMALVSVFMQGLAMFSDIGIGPALIQSARGDDPVYRNTAWTIQIVRGLLLWVGSCAIAWPVAHFYDEPSLVYLIPIVGLTAAITGFQSTAIFIAGRHLIVDRVVKQQLLTIIVGTLITVVLAMVYRDVWSLAWGNVIGSLVGVILSFWILRDHTHQLRWDADSVRHLLAFGRWIFVSTVLTFAALQSDRLLVGKLLGAHVLGIFQVGLMLASIPGQLSQSVDSRVLFPSYSRVHRDGGRSLKSAIHRGRTPLVLLGAAISAALIAAGPELVSGLYDSRYAEAGWMLQVVAFSMLFQQLEMTKRTALVAMGRTRDQAIANGCKVASMCALIPLGYWLHGALGLLLAIVASDAVIYAVTTGFSIRAGINTLKTDLLILTLTVVCAAAGFTAVWLISGPQLTLPHLARASVGAAVAGIPMLGFGAAWLGRRKPEADLTEARP